MKAQARLITANSAMVMRAVATRPMRSAAQPKVKAPSAWPKLATLIKPPMLDGGMCQAGAIAGST